MAQLYGYVGKMARVNLSSGEIAISSSEKYFADYLGSKGVAACIYWEEIGPEVQPFDPENKLIFVSGPANGTGAVGGSKGSLAGKSPVWYPVHSFTHSTTAMFAPTLKRAGFDILIVEGAADHPVYLWISNGKLEIRDAWDLWGKTTRNTRALLWEKHNKHTVVASIGPAGENLVTSACVTVACNTVFGRGGFGAVMGSKKLKAIAVYGTGRINVAEPMKLLEVNRDRMKFESIKVGEKRIVGGQEIVGKPWEETAAVNFGSVGADTQLRDMARLGKAKIKPNACEGCFVFCRTKYNFPDGSLPNSSVICASNIGSAPLERLYNGGKKKMLGAISYDFAQTLDDLGLNINDFSTLSVLYGQTTPFDENEQIEGSLQGGDWLYQGYLFGIFNEENTGLPWDKVGGKEYNDALLKMVVYREGFGDVIARGFRYATQYVMEHEEFGPNRDKMLYIYQRIYSKAGNMGCLENGHGQYVPNAGRSIYTAVGDRTGSEPEFMWSSMLKMPSGLPEEVREKWLGEGSNKILDLYYWGPEVAHAVIKHEDYCAILDSMHLCEVGTITQGGVGISAFTNRSIPRTRDFTDWLDHTPHGGPELLSAIFGREVTMDELNKTGARISNLVRAIWVRDGYTSFDDPVWGGKVDGLWDLHFERKGKDGRNLTQREGFEATLQDYYKERGWKDGVPTRATLEAHGLKDVADDLDKRGLLKA